MLSRNSNITWDIVKDNPEKPWNFLGLSYNQNITWEIVKDNLDKPWDWDMLSTNPNITWEIIRDNPDKPWDWYGLSSFCRAQMGIKPRVLICKNIDRLIWKRI